MVTENINYWEKYGFFGGHLYLDFINTVNDLEKTRKLEGLPDWASILNWSKKSGLINNNEKTALSEFLNKDLIQKEIISLRKQRELGFSIFSKLANGDKPNSSELKLLGDHITVAFEASELQHNSNKVVWEPVFKKNETSLIRLRLLLASHDLLTKYNLDKLSVCGACTGLFLNNGRGVGRKWCRMNTCGNRAKINKFRSTHS